MPPGRGRRSRPSVGRLRRPADEPGRGGRARRLRRGVRRVGARQGRRDQRPSAASSSAVVPHDAAGASEAAARTSTWAPVDLAAILDGSHVDPAPTILKRDDGEALLYPGRIHQHFRRAGGMQGVGGARRGPASASGAGEDVLYVDFEDSAASVVSRLLALGARPETIASRFAYVRPDEPIDATGRAAIADTAGCSLAILDGLTEALTLHGLDLTSNTDVAKWLELLPRPLAPRRRCRPRDRSRRQGPRAARALRDRRATQARGHRRSPTASRSSARSVGARDGHVQLIVQKDRPGYVRGFAEDGRAADVQLVSHADDAVTVRLEATADAARSCTFRPTTLMARVAEAVEATPGLSKRAIRTAVRGRNDAEGSRARGAYRRGLRLRRARRPGDEALSRPAV